MTDLEEPGSAVPDDAAGGAGPDAGGDATGAEGSATGTGRDAAGSGQTPTAETRRGRRATDGKPPRRMSALRETAIVLGTALVLSLLIKTFLVQSFFIPSESMEPTLVKGDRVLVSRLVPGPLDLHRGDIVVFVDPGDWLRDPQETMNPVQRVLVTAGEWVGLLPANTGSHLIKRVIGLPGDHVVCCDPTGRITVNGVSLDEPYVMPGAAPSLTEFDVVVPDGNLWVLGDNRGNSGDSRAHMGGPGGGFVPMEGVVGVAQVRLWPFDRFGVLHNPGATFVDVPDPTP
ncbi:signal peptidase I [Salana multivorans]|uniref:Signal peptidase I n=1 Tax=Salana multivorans TaxID=120377 RepID=A0A3N2D2D1_9MICO|nr:signal peptidase I [Salana multivorans]ROR93936.1 signal peptidase I [Salana multivorans]